MRFDFEYLIPIQIFVPTLSQTVWLQNIICSAGVILSYSSQHSSLTIPSVSAGHILICITKIRTQYSSFRKVLVIFTRIFVTSSRLCVCVRVFDLCRTYNYYSSV